MTPEILDNLPYIAGGLFLVGGVLAAALWRGGGGSDGPPRKAADPRKGAEGEPQGAAKEDSRVPGLAILGVVPAVDEGHPLLLHRLPPNAPLAEAYRQVWAQVGVTAKDAGEAGEGDDGVVPRVFAVAGLDGHSGASTTTANLATAAARLGYRVLVVDADLARPSQGELLCPYADPASPGLAEMLASGNLGDAPDVAQQTLADGVRLIPAGDVSGGDGQSDLFGLIPSQPSRRFIRSVVPALADIVLFDCPPILSGEPGMEAMCEVEDGVLVVVGADGFDKARLAQAVKWLKEAGGDLRGAILVPPIRDDAEEETVPAAPTAAPPRTSSEIIAAAIADSETDAGDTDELAASGESPDFEDEEEAEETMPEEQQTEPVTASVEIDEEDDEDEEEAPARPLFLSESGAPPADTTRRRPATTVGGSAARARATDAIPASELVTVSDTAAAASPVLPVSTAPVPPTAFSVPVTAGDAFPAAAIASPAPPSPPVEPPGTADAEFGLATGHPFFLEDAEEEEPDATAEGEVGQDDALEAAVFTTEEITADDEGGAAADEAAQAPREEAVPLFLSQSAAETEGSNDEDADPAEITAPDASRMSVSLDDIAFAESFAEAFANAPESTFVISEGETVTLVPTTEAQTLTTTSPPLPVSAAFVPAVAATSVPAATAVSGAARRTEMMMEMVAGAEDATIVRATTAPSASAHTPRVTLEITTKRGEALGTRAGTPNASEDGQLPPDVLLETSTREEAPDAATMRLLVSDASAGDEAGDGTVLEASLQKPEAIMIRSGAGQTGEVGVRFEVNSDQSGGTRFRATVAHRDDPATYLVEMERTLVEESLPHGTADVPKRQWRNRVSLRTVEKE